MVGYIFFPLLFGWKLDWSWWSYKFELQWLASNQSGIFFISMQHEHVLSISFWKMAIWYFLLHYAQMMEKIWWVQTGYHTFHLCFFSIISNCKSCLFDLVPWSLCYENGYPFGNCSDLGDWIRFVLKWYSIISPTVITLRDPKTKRFQQPVG